MNAQINSVAVIITSFNRKEKTLTCLSSLYASKNASTFHFEMDVYLTDDGSTDGTSEAIKKSFPNVNVINKNGNLYWAGGMRNSWTEALKKNYKAFLLLNDDTILDENCFDELTKTHKYSVKQYGTGGIYIGSVKDPHTNICTYGGHLLMP